MTLAAKWLCFTEMGFSFLPNESNDHKNLELDHVVFVVVPARGGFFEGACLGHGGCDGMSLVGVMGCRWWVSPKPSGQACWRCTGCPKKKTPDV